MPRRTGRLIPLRPRLRLIPTVQRPTRHDMTRHDSTDTHSRSHILVFTSSCSRRQASTQSTSLYSTQFAPLRHDLYLSQMYVVPHRSSILLSCYLRPSIVPDRAINPPTTPYLQRKSGVLHLLNFSTLRIKVASVPVDCESEYLLLGLRAEFTRSSR